MMMNYNLNYMMKMYKTVILSLLVTSALAGSVNFKDCGSTGAKVSSVDVGGCSTEPCHIVRNTNATLTVNFTATENVSAPTNSIYGIIDGVQVKFPHSADCCAGKNIVCPIKSGTTTQYNNAIFVSSADPKIQLLIKLAVLDDNKKEFFCIVFPAVITDS